MFPALIVAALAAAAPLFAWGSEGWFGLAPCELCLWQRWPYAVAAVVALLAALLPRQRRPLLLLAAIAVSVSGLVAIFHLGVEQGAWPSPLPGCQAPRSTGGMDVDALLNSLAARPSKPCDAATYLIPGLPLSMAAMNLLYAIGLGVLALSLARQLSSSESQYR